MTRSFKPYSLAALLAAAGVLLGSQAVAQQREGRDDRRQRQDQSDQYDAQDQDRQRQDRARRDQQGRQARDGSQVRLEPMGWVRVATDYNNDGRYDHVDWVWYYDLKQAQARSRQRDRGDQPDQQAQRGAGDQRDRQARSDQQRRQRARVRGEIQKTRTITLSDGDQAVVATLQTEQGDTRRVLLAPKKRLERLDLQQGDRVTVEGHRARLNNRQVVMAQRVSANNQSVDLPRRQGMRRFIGEVVSKRTTTFRGRDGEYVVARVRTRDGQTKTVNLGRKNELQDLDLQEGDRISVLGRPTTIDGESGLLARRIQANDQSIRVGETQRDQRRSR